MYLQKLKKCSSICFCQVSSVVATNAVLSDLILHLEIIRQLESSLSQWTSYQEDVRQFVGWMERVEESLDRTEQCPEMRDKTANLSKAKVLQFYLSHFLVLIYMHDVVFILT